jgi:hypothetical protein
MQLTLDSAVLEALLERATMASRLVGHIDESPAPVIEPLADSIDEIVHTLSELLGDPCTVTTAPGAGSSPSSVVVYRDDLRLRGATLAVVGSGEAL